MASMTTGNTLAQKTAANLVLSFRAACSETNLSMSTLRRLVKAGRGPRVVQLSERRVGIRRVDLEDWLSASSSPGNLRSNS